VAHPEADRSADSDKASDPLADPEVARPHAALRYTTLRLGLFIVALALLWLVRVRDGVLLVAMALILSGLASYVLLARQRDAMSAQLHAARERRRARALAVVSREDVEPVAADNEGAVHTENLPDTATPPDAAPPPDATPRPDVEGRSAGDSTSGL
jgi:hypothetical protein